MSNDRKKADAGLAKPSGVLAVAHRICDDGTDEEVAVVQSADYAEAQIAIHEALVHAGYGAAVPA